MNIKETNPNANVPQQDPDEPRGDRGHGDKTWSPGQGDQGISNRPGDEDDASEDGREEEGE